MPTVTHLNYGKVSEQVQYSRRRIGQNQIFFFLIIQKDVIISVCIEGWLLT